MSKAATKRSRKLINDIRRAKGRTPSEPKSTILEIERKHRTVSAKEDAPYAKKRQSRNVTPLEILAREKNLPEHLVSEAQAFAKDYRRAYKAQKVTASHERMSPGTGDEAEAVAKIDAARRILWIRTRVEGEGVWPVLLAILVDEQSVLSWITENRRHLEDMKARIEAVNHGLREATDQGEWERGRELSIEHDDLEQRIAKATGRLIGESRASKLFSWGVVQVAALRRDYRNRFGDDGLPLGEPLTEEAAAERMLVLGR